MAGPQKFIRTTSWRVFSQFGYQPQPVTIPMSNMSLLHGKVTKNYSDSRYTEGNFTVRPAKHEDYDAVMGFGDVLLGRDYLPAMYHRYLKDPDIYPFVIEINNRVGSFFMYQILDDGQTSYFRGARTHPDFRNLRLTKLMTKVHKKETEAIHPLVLRIAGGIGDNVAKDLKDSMGFKEVLRKRRISLGYTGSEIPALSEQESNSSSKIQELTSEDLEALFLNTDVVERMFPHGLLFNWTISYRPVKSNIRYLINDYSSVYVTTTSGKPGEKNEGRHLSDVMISEVDLLTCSHSHRTLTGQVYSCEIYSSLDNDVTNLDNDVTSLESHLFQHVQRMKQMTDGHGVMMVNFPDSISDDVILKILSRFNIHNVLPVPEKSLVLFEIDLWKRRSVL